MRIRGVGKEPGEIQETQTKAGYEGKLRAVKISLDWKVCLSAPGAFLFQIFYSGSLKLSSYLITVGMSHYRRYRQCVRKDRNKSTQATSDRRSAGKFHSRGSTSGIQLSKDL